VAAHFPYSQQSPMKLRTFLLTIIFLTLVPLLGVAGLAIWWAHEDERRNMEQALLYHARSLTVAVDREVETSLAGLKGLATSPDLDPGGDLRRFYEEARLAREAHRRWLTVALVDPSGRTTSTLASWRGVMPLPSPRTVSVSSPVRPSVAADSCIATPRDCLWRHHQ